jgi:hypothetical protein
MDTASYCCAVRTEAHHPDSAHERGRSEGPESGEQLFLMHFQQGANLRPLINLRPRCVRKNLGSGRGLYLWQVFEKECALELNRGIGRTWALDAVFICSRSSLKIVLWSSIGASVTLLLIMLFLFEDAGRLDSVRPSQSLWPGFWICASEKATSQATK